MKKEIILIDYENVQEIDLKPLLNYDVLVKVFHGESQKFSGDFMSLALQLGKEKIDLIKISGNGKNALDFHISYYMGKFMMEIKNPSFSIVSKDTGFIPLIKHLNQIEKVHCTLIKSISEMQIFKSPVSVQGKDKFELVLGVLSTTKIPKAKKKKTLKNQIVNIFKKEITDIEVEEIFQKLIENKFISCNNDSIVYN